MADFMEKVDSFTKEYSPICKEACAFDPALFEEHGVKRGLRDKNGSGVLAGLTPVSYTHLDVYKRQLVLYGIPLT